MEADMQITLRTRVELDGAKFYFGQDDEAEMIMRVVVGAYLQRGHAEEIDEDDPPQELLATFAQVFTNFVRAWEGVTDEEGEAVTFTNGNIADFPLALKARIAAHYLKTREDISGNAPVPA